MNDNHKTASERLKRRRAGLPLEDNETKTAFKVIASKPVEEDFVGGMMRLPKGPLTFEQWQKLKRANGNHWWFSGVVQARVAQDAERLGKDFWVKDDE